MIRKEIAVWCLLIFAKLIEDPREDRFLVPSPSQCADAPPPPLTGDGALFGTIPYMSPEHMTGRTVGHRSDIFSLGIILYEMLTGDRPFRGDSSPQVMSAILGAEPNPVSFARRDIPRQLDLLIGLCLEKDPAERIRSAMSIHEQLRAIRREVLSSPSDTAHASPVFGSNAVLPRAVRRARDLGSDRVAALILLAIVFLVNLVETSIENALWNRYGLGRELGYRLAQAAHWFEGSARVYAYDIASPVVVYGYSIAYFFLLLLLVVCTGWALARAHGREPFRVFALAVAIDYAISLPFFLFFPVPERWAYPDSGAILLSDLWAPALIEVFRPISGLDNCFPSFHVSLTVVAVGLGFFYHLRYRWSAFWLGLLICLSTYVLGIHWLTDIVAGLTAGSLAVAIAVHLNRSMSWPSMSGSR